MPLYAEVVNMMEGLDEGEVNQYFEENPNIIPLFEIDVADIITPYITNEGKEGEIFDTEVTLVNKSLRELCLQQKPWRESCKCLKGYKLCCPEDRSIN